MSDQKIARLDAALPDFPEAFDRLLITPSEADSDLAGVVAGIIAEVATEGDSAVVRFTNRFDDRDVAGMESLQLRDEDIEHAWASIDDGVRYALIHAADRIRDFHERQLAHSWDYEDAEGNLLGQRVSALDRVGIYVPGGRASYPSSVLMNAIPAKVAGVSEIIMVAPAPGGEINPVVLAAAKLSEVDKLFSIGGAQAIAALAYGTQTIPRVDKIVGPGNRYVAEAKRQVFGRVGIDMIAGPSEILIIADGSVSPDWVTLDLFAQAEHDECAQAILISPDDRYIDAVAQCIETRLSTMPRRDIIGAALSNRGALIKVADLGEAVELSNRVAPEHLELAVADPDALLGGIKAAGAIFMGAMSSEALGDYCAGPNHVLPTAGSARFASPLGVYDFQRRSSLIGVSQAGARTLGQTAALLAEAESLGAHAESARARFVSPD